VRFCEQGADEGDRGREVHVFDGARVVHACRARNGCVG
jgi:hypothetical protein